METGSFLTWLGRRQHYGTQAACACPWLAVLPSIQNNLKRSKKVPQVPLSGVIYTPLPRYGPRCLSVTLRCGAELCSPVCCVGSNWLEVLVASFWRYNDEATQLLCPLRSHSWVSPPSPLLASPGRGRVSLLVIIEVFKCFSLIRGGYLRQW